MGRSRLKLIPIMTPEATTCFKMLDEYSRTRHRCFLAEMDLNADKGIYALCFRPLAENRNSGDRYACRYLHIEVEDVRCTAHIQELPRAIIELLDTELPTLQQTH
jgi:hypothetical protein